MRDMEILTTSQAARELGVSADRVRAMIQAGRLPAHKLSREWAIMRSDLEPVRERRPGRPRRADGEPGGTAAVGGESR